MACSAVRRRASPLAHDRTKNASNARWRWRVRTQAQRYTPVDRGSHRATPFGGSTRRGAAVGATEAPGKQKAGHSGRYAGRSGGSQPQQGEGGRACEPHVVPPPPPWVVHMCGKAKDGSIFSPARGWEIPCLRRYESTKSGATKSVPLLKKKPTNYLWFPKIGHE